MAGAEQISFILDLDDTKFVEGINSAKEGLGKIVETLKTAGVVAGLMTAAVLATKAALDMTKEAENIRALHTQFDTLSKQAGIAGDELKEAFDKATRGTMSETEQIQILNRSLAEMGAQASQVPEIFELSRKMAGAFGSDAKTVFDDLTRAISSGATKQLKAQYGLMIDNDQALRKFADANNVAVGALSEFGQKHAITNAILEEAHKRFDNLSTSGKTVAPAMKQIRVALDDAAEAFTLAFDRLFGDFVRNVVTATANAARAIKSVSLALFGNESQKTAEKIKGLTAELESAKRSAESFKDVIARDARPAAVESAKKALAFQEARVKKLQEQIAKLKPNTPEADGGGETEEEKKVQAEKLRLRDIDARKRKALEATFNSELAQIRLGQLSTEESFYRDKEQIDQIYADRKTQNEILLQARIAQIQASGESPEQRAAKIAAVQEEAAAKEIALENAKFDAIQRNLDAQVAAQTDAQAVSDIYAEKRQTLNEQEQFQVDAIRENDRLTEEMKESEIMNIREAFHARTIAMIDEERNARAAAGERNLADAQDVGEGVAGAFKNAAAQGASDLKNFGKTGKTVFGAFETNSVSALEAWGSGTKSAADAAKGAVFGMLGDIAVAQGRAMFAAGLVPPPIGIGPIGLIAGGALIALGSFLKSQGSGGGSSPPSGGGGGGGVAGSTAQESDRPSMAEKQTPKAVTIQVMGSYFETDQTKQRLVEMIRESSDATDFNVRDLGK